MARTLSLALFGLAACPFLLTAGIKAAPGQDKAVYEGPVETALKAHCGSCHSGQSASSGLDLTSYAGVLRGGDSGKVVVPGRAEESLLVQRLEGKGGMPQMPLGFKPLSADKIEAVRKWINDGCGTKGSPAIHWAYIPPKTPPVPQVKLKNWVRNPIDSFVLSRLEKENLSPARPASQEALVRRLYLDLNGLPPTPEEVDAFVADQKPHAYERLVDKLLASPRFGERMARPWLDLARYADSDGYEKDLNRTAWKYRDWVIDAFNQNMRYDQFTIEQLAGDMLPSPSLNQLVATGFNRNAMFNSEGGVDPGEAHFNVVLDRVNTTSTVWLGSTIQCARCHDHKYDPFSQRDFYKLYAIFGNTEVYKLGDYKKGQESWYEATVDVPTPAQAARKEVLERALPAIKHSLVTPSRETKEGFENWLSAGGESERWDVNSETTAVSEGGQALTLQSDHSFLASGKTPANDSYTVTLPLSGTVGTVRLEVLPDPSFPNKGPGRASSGNFLLTKVELFAGGTGVPIERVETSFTQTGYDAQRVIAGDRGNGWAIFNAYGQRSVMLIHPRSTVDAKVLKVVLRFDSNQWPEHVLGRFRLSTTSVRGASVLSNSVQAALNDPAKREANREALLMAYQRTLPSKRSTVERYERLQAELNNLKAQIPTAMVMREKPDPNLKANIHVRGEYLQKGDEVLGGPPSVVSPRPLPKAYSRLDFAKWLVQPDNPLTARVQVNRLWEIIFGRGIVETSEDLGTQGAPPSHPELLDWLSVKFVKSGWDMKAMLKLIVTSSTYRQSSESTALKNKKDPTNVLLSRSPRYRLEAEAVRDTLLSIGGVLSPKMGGPSVFPSQPPAIWDTPYNGQRWMDSQGEDKYRRGIYTFWKRSAPYPSFFAMDATTRETCTVRRVRTNTPSQALALLNDEVSMDAAKGLAARMAKQPDLAKAVSYGFKACTSRSPSGSELEILIRLFTRTKARIERDKSSGAKLGKHAPFVMVANTLLNMDETINRN